MARPSRSSIVFILVGLGAGMAAGACGSSTTNGGAPHEDGGPSSTDASGTAEASTTDGGGDGGAPSAGPALVIEPDQGMTPIYDFVGTAKKTLDMTMYELVDTTFTGLLTTAAKNGVTVRVILDQNLEMSSNTTAYDALQAGGVQVHWANATYSATHQKTITVDGTTSAIMSLNLVASEYKTSRDFAVITSDAPAVAAIEACFEADFANATIAPSTADGLVWSPTNSQGSMVALMNGATATLLVENEEMSDYAIVDALTKAAGRGVNVTVVMENSTSYTSEFQQLVAAGVHLATYGNTHGGLYIHAKVILADYGTSNAGVFVGSENFSSASLTKNRELGIITNAAAILDGVHATLTSDFTGGTTYKLPDAGSVTSADASTDASPDAADGAADDEDGSTDAGADAASDAADGTDASSD